MDNKSKPTTSERLNDIEDKLDMILTICWGMLVAFGLGIVLMVFKL